MLKLLSILLNKLFTLTLDGWSETPNYDPMSPFIYCAVLPWVVIAISAGKEILFHFHRKCKTFKETHW